MSDQLTAQVIQAIGVVGILAVTLYAIARTIAPLVKALIESQQQTTAAQLAAAEAMRQANESHKAIMERWQSSDAILSKNTSALDNAAQKDADQTKALIEHTAALIAMTQNMTALTDQQRVLVDKITPLLITVKDWDTAVMSIRAVADQLVSAAARIETQSNTVKGEIITAIELLIPADKSTDKPADAVLHPPTPASSVPAGTTQEQLQPPAPDEPKDDAA